MHALDIFYLTKEQNLSICLLSLRDIILGMDSDITPAWKYGMPFFLYKGKMFCYLWVKKDTNHPYIGIVEGNRIEHPLLLSEKRARMKIITFDIEKDLPVIKIHKILNLALDLYKTGEIPLK